jgi:hypothetical protein
MTLSPDAIAWERVRRLSFVPFLFDGRCALLPTGDGPALPSGEVLEGEAPMLDTGLRVPPVTAGFRRQGFHPFAAEGDHLYVWCEATTATAGPWTTRPSSATAASWTSAAPTATCWSRWWPGAPDAACA